MAHAVHTWDPDRYLTYSDERGRPFVELVARIAATDPATVVDLGCGPGNLTGLLKERWPHAAVSGLDSSPEMIARATGDRRHRLRRGRPARVGGHATARPARRRVDVLVSNATLQWVPGHLELLPALVGRIRPGGWLAFQVPGNFDEPCHTIRRELADKAPYRPHTRDLATPASHDPATYLEALADHRLRRRRVGDDLPARAQRSRTRSSAGSAAPALAPRSRHWIRWDFASVRGRVQGPAGNGLSRARVRRRAAEILD